MRLEETRREAQAAACGDGRSLPLPEDRAAAENIRQIRQNIAKYAQNVVKVPSISVQISYQAEALQK